MNNNLIFLFVILILTICSCQEEPVISISKTIQLDEAKTLFNKWKNQNRHSSINRNLLKYRTDSVYSASYSKEPDWIRATVYFDEAKRQTVMEIPIVQDSIGEYYLSFGATSSTTDTTFSSNNRSLVIIRDTFMDYQIAVCNIIPTEEYMINFSENISINNYRFKDSVFSGLVLYGSAPY